jgi:hypothetical protein
MLVVEDHSGPGPWGWSWGKEGRGTGGIGFFGRQAITEQRAEQWEIKPEHYGQAFFASTVGRCR